ncbi:hypothetical protein EDB81DRAFT_954171 [Dactylonectria macrodidyma]|uniref:Apple domain-containing protein n=1 Tax=Dactylonectria macrodidyma TaxID=307937 RepID=A0A9P9D023_9HYPO|nr:hypothetical protein EDB81DRAFT_954171 [Dactylonectria macrodidyma]
MRFLALLATALPLVYSLPTDPPLSLNPPLESIAKRTVSTERSCGLVGYDQNNPAPFYTKSYKCNVADCLALCLSKPECKSYATSSSGCYLYSAAVAGNFYADANSPLKFYDKACSAGGALIRLENMDGSLYGYMSDFFNIFGERTTAAFADALKVDYQVSSSIASQLNLVTVNSEAYVDLEYLSGIVGFGNSNSDLGPGSYNYLYLGASLATPPGSTPQSGIDNSFTRATTLAKNVESALWKIDLNTLELTPQWVNTDGSTPAVYVGFAQNIVIVTGDITAFMNRFGNTVQLKLRLELST